MDIQILFPVFDVHMYAFLLNVFLGEEWLDSRAGMCLAFVHNAKKSSNIYTKCTRTCSVPDAPHLCQYLIFTVFCVCFLHLNLIGR